MLAKTLTAFSLANDPKETPMVREYAPPRLSQDELRGQAQSLLHPGSVLDGIQEPIRGEDVRSGILRKALGDIALLAHRLGFGNVSGRNSSYVGGDYVYVPSGQAGGEGYNRIDGPGFRPEMNGPVGSTYKEAERTSFRFPDVWVSLSDLTFGEPRVKDHGVNEIVTVEVDNGRGTSAIETSLMIEYYSQGAVECAMSRNWSDNFNWNVSLSSTVNFGDPTGMFPSASVTLTGGIGGGSTDGGSSSRVKTAQEAQRLAITERVTTAPHTREIYGMTGTTDHCIIPFTGMATLEFSVLIHGFLRWGGGKRFEGETNYHNRWSGSGDRPDEKCMFGGGGIPWYQSLRDMVRYNTEPYNWNALIKQHPDVQALVDRVNSADYRKNTLSFPISGVIGGVSRRNVKFVTIESEPVTDIPSD